MPETGDHHVLNGTGFAVCEFDFDSLTRWQGIGIWFRRGTGPARLAFFFWFRLQRFAVPLGIAEMMMRLHEIVNGEIILAVVKASATTDDLLELNHGVDGTHEDDVANVASVDTRGEFLRGGENRWDESFVVLKVAEMLFAKLAIVGG